MNKINLIKLKKDNLIFSLSVFVIVIGQLSSLLHAEWILLLAFALVIVLAFKCPRHLLIPFMLFFLAPNRILTYEAISVPTIIIVISIVRFIKKIRIDASFFVCSLSLVLLTIVSANFGSSMTLDAFKIVLLLLFLQLYSECDIEEFYTICIEKCAYGCVISFIIAIILNPSSIINVSRFSLTSSGENVLGILAGVLFVNLVYIIFIKGPEDLFKYYCLSVCVLCIGFLTGSRSFFIEVGIAIIGLLLWLIIYGKWRLLLKTMVFILFVSTFLLMLYSQSMQTYNYIEGLINRIIKLQSSDVSNGRFEIWEQYAYVFSNHPIYLLLGGLDFNAFAINFVAHNMIIEQVASYGIVGSGLITYIYFKTFKNIKNKSSSELILSDGSFISLLSFLLVSMVSHTLLGVPQTSMLFMCLISIYKNKRSKGMVRL